jgi:anti-sigma factor RsiW
MHGDGTGRESTAGLPDSALWQKSRLVDMAEEESERFLDLAGFADGRLDPDDRERVAEWLAGDPIAAGDVAAARSLAAAVERADAAPQSIIARASSLVGAGMPQPAAIIPFPQRHRYVPGLRGLARWGSLVAAMAVAGWLGFTLGMDTSRSVAQIGRAGEDGFLQELLDPSVSFLRDLTEGAPT